MPFIFQRFSCEKVCFYLGYPNDIEGEKIAEKNVRNSEIMQAISFNFLREMLNNNRNDYREYFEKLRNLIIKIEGKLTIKGNEYFAYILIPNSRLTKVYGSFFLDIYATDNYYNFFELIQKEDPNFIEELENFIMKDDNKIKEFVKSCFVVNDNSDKDFPFNSVYLYYDSPLGYVNDGFIEVYKKDSEAKSHLSPVKSFLARKIAGNESFRNYLFEESKAVGMVAQSGSLSIRVIKEGALEAIYENIKKRIDSLVRSLPREDYFESEIEKRFKL